MNINHLLDKYWSATSSLDEEKLLQDYFASDDIKEEHLSFRPLFASFKKEQQVELEQEIILPHNEKSLRKTKIFKLRNMGIAASILFAVMILFNTYNKPEEHSSNTVSVETPEEALAYTRQALAMVSNNLSKGSQSMMKGMKPLSKANIFSR